LHPIDFAAYMLGTVEHLWQFMRRPLTAHSVA